MNSQANRAKLSLNGVDPGGTGVAGPPNLEWGIKYRCPPKFLLLCAFVRMIL